MCERIQHWKLHARNAQLRQNAAVHELHERMHHALWVHHDFDAVVRETKKVVRLDYFERLVRERGAIDGDLSPHAPRRMLQRIGDGRALQAVCAPRTEWSA